jgi:nicotinate-nucleotide--dimethylbenzimidazole phosphoribosyltransferase
VPVIGDATSATERRDDPRAWALPAGTRDALHDVIARRRDIRRFRPDVVPGDVLLRILAAGHAAPSVGHSQPWRFLVVRDPATRERAALLADRERLRQAAALQPEAGRRLLDLQLEGIREAPVGVVVCCDRRSPARGVLGRATFPDADLWSCAAAIENMWLAARADGVGIGWVTLFEPADLAELLHLPEGVVTLGWLCVGWPDERPPEPGLERAGWSRRLPLEDVVCAERWPAEGPGPERPVSHLRAPAPDAVVGARDGADTLLTPAGSLGVIDRALDRIAALPSGELGTGTLVLAGADHPVSALGVSAYGAHVTRDVLTAAAAGEAMGCAAARAAGMRAVVVDAGINGDKIFGLYDAHARDARGDLVAADGLSAADVLRLLDAGRVIGAEAAAHGFVALGEVGVGNTTVAAALAGALLDVDVDLELDLDLGLDLGAARLVGVGAGADSAMVARKVDVVTRALARARRERGAELRQPLAAVAALGGPEFAVLAGVTLAAAAAGVPVVLDGFATSVAALVAVRLEPAVAAHLLAAHRSRETGHAAVLTELGLEPLLDARIRAGEGVGACLAAALLRAAAATRAGTARTASQ